jgi:hypothetical protein
MADSCPKNRLRHAQNRGMNGQILDDIGAAAGQKGGRGEEKS